MNLRHIEHLGIDVKNIETAVLYYYNVFGLICYSIEEVSSQKVKTSFFKIGYTKLELLEPTNKNSKIPPFI